MTYETCKRLAEHCRKMGDEAGALMYEERAKLHPQPVKVEKEKKEKSKKS